MSRAENESPMPNMRKTTPSCPTVCVDRASARKLPPHVCSLITTPARMYPRTFGHPSREKTAAASPAIAISIARSWKNALSIMLSLLWVPVTRAP